MSMPDETTIYCDKCSSYNISPVYCTNCIIKLLVDCDALLDWQFRTHETDDLIKLFKEKLEKIK